MSKLNKYKPDSLVFYEAKKNDVFTTSKDIAKGAEISHKKIKLAIRKYKNRLEHFGKMVVRYETTFKGQKETLYDLNEQQATFLITLLKNTDKVLDFKEVLVREFYKLKEIVREKKTKDWEFQRLVNKTTRKIETDQIKIFVEYASINIRTEGLSGIAW